MEEERLIRTRTLFNILGKVPSFGLYVLSAVNKEGWSLINNKYGTGGQNSILSQREIEALLEE